MSKVAESLEVLVNRELEVLASDATGKEKDIAFNRLMQLNDLAIKAEEIDSKKRQSKVEKWLGIAGIGIQLVGIGVPIFAYGRWFAKGLKFEETGTVNSDFMRNLMSRFKMK